MTTLLPAPPASPVILRRELIAAGHSDRTIARLCADGGLVKLRHGAYVTGAQWASADPNTKIGLVTRAVLRQANTELVASHTSAVAEYEGPTWGVPSATTHVTRLDRRCGRKEAGVAQHRGLLLPGDVVERNGLLTTSGVRTALDVTTMLDVEAALVHVSHLLHSAHATPEQLRTRYASMEHHPSTLRTDLVLRLADPRLESVGEARVLYLMWHQSLPKPELQLPVTGAGGLTVARLDFAWPERQRWVEFDGVQKYVKLLRDGESVTDVVLREKQREDLVRELTGWRCLRITWAELADPVRLAARIRAFLG